MNQQIENLNDFSNNKLMKSLYRSDSLSGSILQNEITKDLVVSIDSNNYNRPNKLMFPLNDSSISSKTVNIKRFKDLNESLILFDDLNMTKKNIKRNESIFSCLLIQQYFVYFVLCAFILLCSLIIS